MGVDPKVNTPARAAANFGFLLMPESLLARYGATTSRRTPGAPARPLSACYVQDRIHVPLGIAVGIMSDTPAGASASPSPSSQATYTAPLNVLPTAWASHVCVQLTTVNNRRLAAMAQLAEPDPNVRTALDVAVVAHLNGAGSAISSRYSWRGRLVDWWSGTSVEQAFASLHAARVALVAVLPDEDVRILVPDALARVGSCLFPADARRLAVEELAAEPDPVCQRVLLHHALEVAYAASDEAHARLRALRNVLLIAAFLIAIFMLSFICFVSIDPSAVPLCFHRSLSAAEAGGAVSKFGGSAADYPYMSICPTSEQVLPDPSLAPDRRDVQIIAGLGVLGGALSAAVSIRSLSGKVTPYGIPVAVAVLKLPIGALTAVAGIVLLGGSFVPGLSDLDSQGQILAYALVLGFAQQLVTQFIDRRAAALIAQVPSKQSEAPPTKSLLTPTTWAESPPNAAPKGRSVESPNGSSAPS